MKISNTLPQFDDYPVLFIVSGEFESRFIIAKNGVLKELQALLLNPREEAKEKQGFISKTGGKSLGAVSHHERYMEDLKKRFRKELSELVSEISDREKIREICVIAPKHAANQLKQELREKDRSLIHLTMHGLHTRQPIDKILELYKNELGIANNFITSEKSLQKNYYKETILT
jgi:hypothetical protein